MKKSLKGIVLASLISTQVLTAPLSAWATNVETPEITENSEQVGLQHLDEEDLDPKINEEKTETPTSAETTDQGEAVESPLESEAETPIPEPLPEAPETPETPIEEMPTTTASEAKIQEVKDAVVKAQAILDEGTYLAETTLPLKMAMSAATTLINQAGVTDEQLDNVITDINEKVLGLIKAEVELSFVVNLITAIDEATQIINNTDKFKDIYTPASVAAKKVAIQTAVDAGKMILAGVIDAQGKFDPEASVTNRAAIIAAADAIITAINDGNGLVRRDHLVDILIEANGLEGAKVASDENTTDFENAVENAIKALDNALTDAEADAAVSALRAAMDKLHLVVVVSAVDEAGNLIVDQTTTSLSGLYKTAWSVEPPVVEGYEYVSSNNQPVTFARTSGQVVSGTFGDGTNDVTFVYKKAVDQFEPPYEAPEVPTSKAPVDNLLKQPAVIGLTNDPVSNTTNSNNTYYSKKKLPQTGEQTSAMTSFGLMAIAVGTLAFFKKRKIKE
ncbi:hypothetical protein ATZ33_15785 [Enterococcus silesiacus]|uniref:Gram-positive cocci surface proteins LPxTG domain-containing protein n=1 Tax=Enterococcus silesiacus TaxID=332949 RepID=A0A0S3KEU6_9ENTE|nr:MucBP domain-containing protein [Enterococcus silesiacus]ALS02786.1 hypothetical protein ATZ33_15785 [Enterococcus silesiacus]OJG87242.1 hypothetical protein RV15_GL002006 [Enterococcus silesiacus]